MAFEKQLVALKSVKSKISKSSKIRLTYGKRETGEDMRMTAEDSQKRQTGTK